MTDEQRERFVARAAGDLARFAQLVCPDPDAAAELVEQGVRRAVEDQPDASMQWPEAARVWIVRAALSQGRRLEGGVAADVDVPHSAEPGADVESAFAASSPLQRCVTVLHWFEHLDAGDIAAVVGSTPEGIAAYLDAVRTRLGLGTDSATSEQQLRRLLRRKHEDADPCSPQVGAAVRRALDLPTQQEQAEGYGGVDTARRVAEMAAAQAIRRRDEADRRRAEAEAATAVAVAAAEQAAARAARAAAEVKVQQAAADREICERVAAERAAAEAEERRRKAEAAAITAETALAATVSTVERTERTLLELNSALERQRRASGAPHQAHH